MFDNIGAKIKIMAKIIYWVLGIASIIVGGSLIYQGSGASYGGEALVTTGLEIFIGGSLGAWISSWFLYGFGVLIENTEKIAKNMESTSDYGGLLRRNTDKIVENTARSAKNTEIIAARNSLPTEKDKKLKLLIGWRDNNLISEEEFESKKKELLRGE